jgi:KaiC/GvpD/RAD55 family RecA-like ATPase
LGRCFVFVATEVEETMDHHPMQFLRKGRGELLSVVTDPGNGDVKFSLQSLWSGVIEGDDVRVIVVFEMGPIELKQVFVAAEDDGDRFYFKSLILSDFK